MALLIQKLLRLLRLADMAIVRGFNKLYSLEARGRFGYSSGFGRIVFGRCLYGIYNDFGGQYQVRHTLTGRQIVKMRISAATNPKTPKQQAWRAILASGWPVYNALTPTEKLALSKEARTYRLSGPSLFFRRYLQAHR